MDFYTLWIIIEISVTSSRYFLGPGLGFDPECLRSNPWKFQSTVTSSRLSMIFGPLNSHYKPFQMLNSLHQGRYDNSIYMLLSNYNNLKFWYINSSANFCVAIENFIVSSLVISNRLNFQNSYWGFRWTLFSQTK